MAVFVFLTVFLVNKDVAVYQDILKILIIFGSGLGFKIYLDRKNKETLNIELRDHNLLLSDKNLLIMIIVI